MSQSEEIKSRLDIVDIIKDYIPLRKAGSNYKARCPFHNEKTPSFMVSPEKQIWHCFGCGKGGDVFTFIMEIEGISFIEALRLLAPKAGVTLKTQNVTVDSKRGRLLDIMELAAKFYEYQLQNTKIAEPIGRYLKERGLKQETIKNWRIGYSPNSWDDLFKFLLKKGFKEADIFLTGLVVKKEGLSRFYNRFRNRIMFPIENHNGQIVAFSARVNPETEAEEKMGKYINSPQTLIYDKSQILFGLSQAKLEIKAKKYVVVVEGQMDAISAHQHGFKNTVASSGTALTTQQIKLLKRYTNNLALAFDEDEAGQMAAERGIGEALAQEMNVKIITIPSGKDPDECLRKNPKEWEEAVTKAQPFMDYYFDRIKNKFDFSEIGQKKAGLSKLLIMVKKMKSSVEQDFWLKEISQKTDSREEALREMFAEIRDESYFKASEVLPDFVKKQKSREEKMGEYFLSLLFKFPELINYAVNNVLSDYLSGFLVQQVYNSLIVYYNEINNKEETFDYFHFKSWLQNRAEPEGNNKEKPASQVSFLDELVLLGDNNFENWLSEEGRTELIKTVSSLKKDYLFQRRKNIEKAIAEAEKNNNSAQAQELMAELKILLEEMKNISNLE